LLGFDHKFEFQSVEDNLKGDLCFAGKIITVQCKTVDGLEFQPKNLSGSVLGAGASLGWSIKQVKKHLKLTRNQDKIK
jgi:hypothetical protein